MRREQTVSRTLSANACRRALIVAFVVVTLIPFRRAAALPFNQDMVGGQLVIAGRSMRPKDANSVPVGSLSRQISKAQPYTEANPLKSDPRSALRGERLFKANCQVCHGNFKEGKHVPSDLQAKGIPSFNLLLTQPQYSPNKDDQYIFHYVYYGMDAVMPRYGWKLANNEIWDLVNYVRKLQAENHL